MEGLYKRTNTEMLFVAVRSDHTHYNKPVVYYTSDRIRMYVESLANVSLIDFGIRMEAYCIGGIDGECSSVPVMIACDIQADYYVQ